MLSVQSLLAFQDFIMTTDANWLASELGMSFPWAPLWLNLDSREWLAGDAHCTGSFVSYAIPAPGSKPCGSLYMVLSGYQPLFSDITVKTVTHYLFAASGVPLLLMIR